MKTASDILKETLDKYEHRMADPPWNEDEKAVLAAMEAYADYKLSFVVPTKTFEVGIEVKITKRLHGHEFEIGEVVEIVGEEIDGNDIFWWCSNGTEKWCIEADEAEIYYR